MDIPANTGSINLKPQTRVTRFLMILMTSFLMITLFGATQVLAADVISSAANQIFAVNQATEAIPVITVTNVDTDMTAANDVRIRIPTTTTVNFDSTDTTFVCADLVGTPCANISTTVSYENGNKTLILNVTTNLTTNDSFTVSGLSYSNFGPAASNSDNLDLCVDGSCTGVEATDDKTINIGLPTLVSSAAQSFTIGSSNEALDWTITIAENANGAAINTTDDVYISIPSALGLAFDPNDAIAVIGGTDFAKISQNEGGDPCGSNTCDVTVLFYAADGATACTLEAADCKTVRIPVETNFSTSDDFTLTGLSFSDINVSVASADNLELEVVPLASWGSSATDEDSVLMSVVLGSRGDHDAPDAPSSTVLSINEDAYVVITWSDPSASDVSSIRILRGVDGAPISATPIAYVDYGDQTYIDTDVELGEVVEYILRAQDAAGNLGDSENISITVELAGEEEVTEEEEELVEEEIVAEDPIEVIFEDLEGHWGEAYVIDLYYDGIVSGNEDGDFAPDASITRAEITKMLVNAYDIDMSVDLENPFDDLSTDHWAYDYILAAYHSGMVEGEEGMFSPDDAVNRVEAVKMIVEAAGVEVETPEESSFSDMLVTDWFAGYVEYLVGMEIVGGYDDGTFGIANEITRAEASKIISMMMDLM
jgi:hypothetical protein